MGVKDTCPESLLVYGRVRTEPNSQNTKTQKSCPYSLRPWLQKSSSGRSLLRPERTSAGEFSRAVAEPAHRGERFLRPQSVGGAELISQNFSDFCSEARSAILDQQQHITLELARNAASRAPPRPAEPEVQGLVLKKPFKWLKLKSSVCEESPW